MKQARRLLADPRRRHQTIEGIAALVGCTTGAHFSRQFALFPAGGASRRPRRTPPPRARRPGTGLARPPQAGDGLG